MNNANAYSRLVAFRNRLLNTAAMGMAYRKGPNELSGWSQEYAYDSILQAWLNKSQVFVKEIPQVTIAELREIPLEKLHELGFRLWGSSPKQPVLFPLWAWPLLAEGEKLVCPLFENDVKFSTKGIDDFDLDIRDGVIAWGFYYKEAAETPVFNTVDENGYFLKQAD